MKIKNLILYFFAVCLGGFFGMLVPKKPHYKFTYEPPKFTDSQITFIKAVHSKIFENLENPVSMYVSQIDESDSTVTIYLDPLDALQDGEDPSTGEIKMTLDGRVRLVFSKSKHLISTNIFEE